MSTYLAFFPITGGPISPERMHREALAQLPGLIPDTVIITGDWHGHIRTDPDGRTWWIMSATATGPTDPEALSILRQVAHHIDPALGAWVSTNESATGPTETRDDRSPQGTARTIRRRARSAKHRLEDLDDLITAGTAVEDALARIGWTAGAAAVAARRPARPDLARICGQVSNSFTTAA